MSDCFNFSSCVGISASQDALVNRNQHIKERSQHSTLGHHAAAEASVAALAVLPDSRTTTPTRRFGNKVQSSRTPAAEAARAAVACLPESAPASPTTFMSAAPASEQQQQHQQQQSKAHRVSNVAAASRAAAASLPETPPHSPSPFRHGNGVARGGPTAHRVDVARAAQQAASRLPEEEEEQDSTGDLLMAGGGGGASHSPLLATPGTTPKFNCWLPCDFVTLSMQQSRYRTVAHRWCRAALRLCALFVCAVLQVEGDNPCSP